MPKGDSNYQDYDRMIKNYNLGLKEFARDIKNYNKIAKKSGKSEFACDYKTGVVHMQTFARKCDTGIYRDVMTKKSSFYFRWTPQIFVRRLTKSLSGP